jgi:3-hydroxymyristoyl/3-hydroxydecanoyl-(acyl carrier protein) dehydratase
LSKIQKEIERYMSEVTTTDSILTSSFLFPAEFIGFQGHFPAKKVLPGACQIQCVLSTIEEALEKRVTLKEIVLAKYIAPVLPDDTMHCSVSVVPDAGGDVNCKARITKGAEKVTELKLRITFGASV